MNCKRFSPGKKQSKKPCGYKLSIVWPVRSILKSSNHERFFMIEVHRHRFARLARKVPFEKCINTGERFAEDPRKTK